MSSTELWFPNSGTPELGPNSNTARSRRSDRFAWEAGRPCHRTAKMPDHEHPNAAPFEAGFENGVKNGEENYGVSEAAGPRRRCQSVAAHRAGARPAGPEH